MMVPRQIPSRSLIHELMPPVPLLTGGSASENCVVHTFYPQAVDGTQRSDFRI